MKTLSMKRHPCTRAFTAVELLVVVGITLLLLAAAFVPPMFTGSGRASRETQCISNLKQLGMGYAMWAHDYDGRLPWQVPVAEGGSKPVIVRPGVLSGDYLASFRVLSNYLGSPRILVCPADRSRGPTPSFNMGFTQPGTSTNGISRLPNLSYFTSWDVTLAGPSHAPVAGDSDFSGGLSSSESDAGPWAFIKSASAAAPGSDRLNEAKTGWENRLHRARGNVLAVDTSVARLESPALRAVLARGAGATNSLQIRLVFPH